MGAEVEVRVYRCGRCRDVTDIDPQGRCFECGHKDAFQKCSARLVDPEAVLAQLLEAERDERDRKRRWAGTVEDAAQFEREWLAFAQVISLLAPASPEEGQG